MTALELIHKKRDDLPLTENEIKFFIDGYLTGRIPDYQVAALLMAIYFNDMSDEETFVLTRLMRDSGVVLDFSHLPGPKIDKHSTGGVGDKVSLVLAPLMAAAGIYVPMISGRGLGHTGGTLDKLAAIPGFRTQLPLSEFRRLTQQVGACLIGQTEEICPADRKLYALRDVTGTVPVMPLICASILSKKLAEGLNALVLDVKVGRGAIFQDEASAEKLAQRLINTAQHFGLRTVALLTDMSQPLGNTIGNWVEVREAIEILRGGGPADVRRVTLALGAAMLQAVGKTTDLIEGMQILSGLLQNGAAWRKFIEIVAAQGGEVAMVENSSQYAAPRSSVTLSSDRAGYITGIDARALGHLAMTLGAGRTHLQHSVDPLAGITLHKKVGETITAGGPLATLQSSRVRIDEAIMGKARASFMIADQPAGIPPLIIAMLNESGRQDFPRIDNI